MVPERLLESPAVHPEPELVYALLERYAGRGYATEMARAAIAHACTQSGFRDIVASVDEINAGSRPRAFGPTLMLRIPAGPEAR